VIRELLRIYLMDIIFTGASLYILFNKWEDDNVSARTIKIIKWGLVLFIWITSTIPAIIDLIRMLTQNYIVIAREILKETISNEDTRCIIRIFDTSKNRFINLVIIRDVRVEDVVTENICHMASMGK